MLRLVLALACAILMGDAAWAHTVGQSGGLTLSGHDLTRYIHVVLLVFWLGPEVAIVVAGNYAVSASLNAAQRAGAARMMQYYELMPRVCTSLMLTVGGILSEQVGLTHPSWQMAGIVLLGPVWLVLTLVAYFGASPGAGASATKLEQWLRIALIIGVPVSVAYSTLTGRLAEAPYVGAKLLLFALVLLLGLLGRRALGPFVAGVQKLSAPGASGTPDPAMTASYIRGRRFIVAVGAALMLAALLGIVKPGAPAESEEHAGVSRSIVFSSLRTDLRRGCARCAPRPTCRRG